MQQLVFFVCLASWTLAQNEGGIPQEHNGHGWDIRLAVPGQPGNDYPTLGAIPRTKFSCSGRDPGYYADIEAGCQVFRVCTVGSTYGFQSFLCPNGTLFNQAVFVCDWWMNVNCQESERLFKNNNEQFGNLKLGPQLMKDIKKMLTHPMRNPYDRNSMKSNYVVMQEYKPPSGQLFPNEALIAGPERVSNKVYMPPKQVKQNLIQNSFVKKDLTFSQTTSIPKIFPVAFSTAAPTTRTNEFFQRQRSDTRFIQNTQNPQSLSQSFVSNGHAGQYSYNKITDFSTSSNNNYNTQIPRPTQNYNSINQQRSPKTRMLTHQTNLQNNQRTQLGAQRAQYIDNIKSSQVNSNKDTEFETTTKQNNYYNPNQNFPAYTYRPPLPINLKDIPGDVPDEIKQNVVSTATNLRPTAVTRPAAVARTFRETTPSKPRSRVTVKTWLVKPTKSAKLLASPTAYTYNRPIVSSMAKLVETTTPYVYNTPTSQTITELEDNIESTPYYYSRPTKALRQILSSSTTRKPPRLYLAPVQTTPETLSTFSSSFDLPASTTLPFVDNEQMFVMPSSAPQSLSRYYLPSDNSPTISRQYLPPSPIQELPYESSQLKATPSALSPVYVSNNNSEKPTYTITKQSIINTNRNNLSFADILTKEKLDITVNNIVKDTKDIFRTASPQNFGQYREVVKVTNYPNDSFLQTTTEIGEILTSQAPLPSKSSRDLELPPNYLVPPIETIPTQNTNKLSLLPYFKESLLPAPNTIERTVSLKITIPEKIATYLFKNNSDSDFDKLEILNTGSSNYLILSNNLVTSTTPSIIPIGKLVGNKNKNFSNSQALVFSLLADSINVAKEYTNIAQQESLSTTLTPPPLTTPQLPNVDNGDLSQITNKISQLTSTQFSGNNYNSANIVVTPQTATTRQVNQQYQSNIGIQNHQQIQAQNLQSAPYNIAPPRQMQEQFYSPQLTSNNTNSKANLLNSNENQIYSGQLYQLSVPEVTNEILNRAETSYVQNNRTPQQNLQNTQQIQNRNIAAGNPPRQSRTEVEIVQSKSLPFSPEKLELDPKNDVESLSSDETLKTLLNSDNGISAQLKDKIIGTIPHPLEENKLVTYEKEKSYYLFSKVDSNLPSQEGKAVTQLNDKNNQNIQTTPMIQQTTPINGFPNSLSFQFLPSISYELEDEKEQQKLLNTFQIDEFGAPREVKKENLVEENINQNDNVLTSNIDYSVDHTTLKQDDSQMNVITTLYSGPSSYVAPQSSIGSLRDMQMVQPTGMSSRLETLDNTDGYPKERPARQFTF